jgi:two-component system NarL family sensor kinase
MIFLQVPVNSSSGFNYIMLFGTLAMLSLTLGIVFFVIFHQRRVIRFNDQLKRLEDDVTGLLQICMMT